MGECDERYGATVPRVGDVALVGATEHLRASSLQSPIKTPLGHRVQSLHAGAGRGEAARLGLQVTQAIHERGGLVEQSFGHLLASSDLDELGLGRAPSRFARHRLPHHGAGEGRAGGGEGVELGFGFRCHHCGSLSGAVLLDLPYGVIIYPIGYDVKREFAHRGVF